jgi:signal transduction histidine kinase
MQRGVLLLVLPYHVESQESSWPALASRKTLRPLAWQGIKEDELAPLLATFASHLDKESQIVSSDQGWIICQQVIPTPDAPYSDESPEAVNALFNSPLSLFFLAEAEKEAHSYQATVEKGQALWPQVADVVSMVIMSLLQAERMFELETAMRQRDLQQMELLKAELLASVSHELRSPLTSIKGYASTLVHHERRISQEERHEFLIAIQDASKRLEVVVDRLLEMSQLETATLPLKCVSVNLVSLVREAITAREQSAGRKEKSSSVHPRQRENVPPTKRTFVLHIEEGYEKQKEDFPLFQADQRLLRKVLDHLLENAVLYSPAGRKVEVGLRTIEPEKVHLLSQKLAQTAVAHQSAVAFPPSWSPDQPMAEIWIQDHGIGIPDEHLEQIFQRFHRVDMSLTRAVNGLGLGLAICKQIVELHEGILWAESEVGRGSTFHVLLPLGKDGNNSGGPLHR